MPTTVYLDQLHWITLARAEYSPDKVKTAAELDAAAWLRRQVEDNEVRLPLSCAHLVETARAGTGPRRRQVATTMIQAYRGWQMSHPVDVRMAELRAGLTAHRKPLPTRRQVFTKRPGAAFPVGEAEPSRTDLSPEVSSVIDALSWQYAWETSLLEDSDSADELAAADPVVEAWAARLADLSKYMKENPHDRDMRLVAAGMTYGDLDVELAQVAVASGVSVDDFRHVLNPEKAISFFSGLPFLARVMEVLRQRLQNPSDVWRRTDLTDLLYLCCAAAYSDIVVSERKMNHLLNNATRHVPAGATVVADLSALREKLDLA